MPRFPGFIYGSSPAQTIIADGERSINWLVKNITAQERIGSRAFLVPTPGQVTFLTLTGSGSGGRGLFAMRDQMHAVIGTTMWEVFANQSATVRGSVTQDANPAQIVDNGDVGNERLFSSGGNAYLLDLGTNVFSQVLTGDATMIGMLDGYFLAFDQPNSRFRISGLNDGATWSALLIQGRSAQPDPWRAMIVNPPDIFFLGEQTSDVWYNAGTFPFPFAPRQGLSMPYGVVGRGFSACVVNGSVLWLAQSESGGGVVVQAQGYSPVVVSTPEINNTIARIARTTTITDAEAFTYEQDGDPIYALTFAQGETTLCYNLKTSLWHEAAKTNPLTGVNERWGPRRHARAFNRDFVVEWNADGVNRLDPTFGSEANGSAIHRMRRGPVLVNENTRIPIDKFEILFQAGVGLTATGQGTDPYAMFRGSSDGGNTWSNERPVSLGKTGEYFKRVIVRCLGSPRLWVPEITISDPVPLRIVDAFINGDD